MLTGLIGMAAGVAMIVRFFVGMMFIGRLGDASGFRAENQIEIGDAFAIGTACVYAVALIAGIVLLAASVAMPGRGDGRDSRHGGCAVLGLIFGLLGDRRVCRDFRRPPEALQEAPPGRLARGLAMARGTASAA